ncbi:MAG: hypothetical protein ABMA01_24110, partial [Chthoniobacteraceae bacterium]
MIDAAIESRWSLWLLDRNRRGTLTALYRSLLLYPVYALLDWQLAAPEDLRNLLVTRAVFAALTLALFPVVRSRWFDRHPHRVSGLCLLVGATGISVVTTLLEGMDSPHYAGLSLLLVASGLLFVWPARMVISTHLLVILSFLVPNLWSDPEISAGLAASNVFFLVVTSL